MKFVQSTSCPKRWSLFNPQLSSYTSSTPWVPTHYFSHPAVFLILPAILTHGIQLKHVLDADTLFFTHSGLSDPPYHSHTWRTAFCPASFLQQLRSYSLSTPLDADTPFLTPGGRGAPHFHPHKWCTSFCPVSVSLQPGIHAHFLHFPDASASLSLPPMKLGWHWNWVTSALGGLHDPKCKNFHSHSALATGTHPTGSLKTEIMWRQEAITRDVHHMMSAALPFENYISHVVKLVLWETFNLTLLPCTKLC